MKLLTSESGTFMDIMVVLQQETEITITQIIFTIRDIKSS